jgi:2-keto-4-pentenoate hydratase/2-oxohepta-3-ene-1,7-dioic acid hydratase in catechol pathway
MATVVLKPDTIYQVGKIVCVGQNYLKHISELASKRQDKPVLFLKPSTAILNEGNTIRLPEYSSEVHYETELALLVGKRASRISSENWKEYITGTGIALDLTLRDLQTFAKEHGLPWAIAKGFDGSCPVSGFIPIEAVPDIQALEIELYVNRVLKQHGSTRDMIFPVAYLLEFITSIFTLEPGDIILTGTPSGVGPIAAGDRLEARITAVGSMAFNVI